MSNTSEVYMPIIYGPKPDITAYEVAQCLAVFHCERRLDGEEFVKYVKSLPPEVQRHFEIDDEPHIQTDSWVV